MMLRAVTLLAVVLGALGSLALMLLAGQRTPRVLLFLFFIWMLAPFAALLWAVVVSPRWSACARVMLYGVAFVIAAASPAIYGKVIPVAPAGSPSALVWVIVPPISWLLMLVTIVVVRLSPRRTIAGAVVLAALVWPGAQIMPIADAQRRSDVPLFEVEATWPKPLPNNWAVGPVSGIAADARDHIWIIHRGEAVKEAGRVPAPPVIEFDAAGNIVQAWGGPGAGYDWPQQVHGITVDDANGRVWITGNGEKDTHILAFTCAGKFLRQIGRPGMSSGSNNTANVARATQVRVDARAREIYVSDGEQNQNHRVIVFDSETGAYKRHWGAFGEKPDDAAIGTDSAHMQFGSAVHCVRIDRNGRVYVCDRSNSRFQIFRKDGTYENDVLVPRVRGNAGTVYDLDFSPDQKFIYVADGANQKVWILRRDEMGIVDWFGERGAGAGHFATSLHDLAVDSKGNIYTGEAAAAGRVQKFARRAPRAALSVKDLSGGALDAIADLVLGGGHDDINPAMYPTALRLEIRQYLSRSKAYRSTRRLPKNAGGEAEMGHSRQINSERILAASTADPRAARIAVEYVDALRGCYEWEGMPDCPEDEAIFADKYQLEHPDGPFRELLPLVAAHLWLCAAEFSRPNSERAAHATQGYQKDIAIALQSPLLLIRTAAEGLKARGWCYSP